MSQLYKIAATLVAQYAIVNGDTLSAIAARFGIDLQTLLAANPGVAPEKLQVGQLINVPSKVSAVVQTLADVANALHVSTTDLLSANPGFPSDLRLNEVIKAPAGAPAGAPAPPSNGGGQDARIPGSVGGSSGGGGYVQYAGPASNFPHPNTWASYAALWDANARLMKFNDSDAEIAFIKSAIETVAKESGVDVRVILCIIMQESGGNVRVGTTNNGVTNPGIMQSHNGVSFDPKNPAGSILQMVRDGTEGTASGDGLKQCFAHQGNWYAAFREYNSGTVDQQDMNDPVGATPGYVRDAANRLMGHVWDGM